MASLTFDQALEEAKRRLANVRTAKPSIPDDPIDAWLVDALGEDLPCGWEPVRVTTDGAIDGAEFTPAEARCYAALLLRAADEADALLATRKETSDA